MVNGNFEKWEKNRILGGTEVTPVKFCSVDFFSIDLRPDSILADHSPLLTEKGSFLFTYKQHSVQGFKKIPKIIFSQP